MTPTDLLKYVGTEYRQLDDNGKALGCMLPVYMLYPHLPRFNWPEGDLSRYMLRKFKSHTTQVPQHEMMPGDILLLRLFSSLVHPAVYLGNDLFVDCSVDTGLQAMRLSIVRQILGVYRCQT